VLPGPDHQHGQDKYPGDEKENTPPKGRFPEEEKPCGGKVILEGWSKGVPQPFVELHALAVTDKVDAIPGRQFSCSQKISSEEGSAGLIVPENMVREAPTSEKDGA